MENEKSMKKRPKLQEIPIIADDLNSILDMSIRSLKLGRPAKFEDSEQGLEDFKSASIAYMEYVQKVNNDESNEHHIIPDIEGWATFLGTNRMTILNYEKNRGEDWKEFIALVKGAIVACKKQLAFRQKIPTLLAVFDLTNNSDYVNTSEFKLRPETESMQKNSLTAAELPKLGNWTGENAQALPVFGMDEESEKND